MSSSSQRTDRASPSFLPEEPMPRGDPLEPMRRRDVGDFANLPPTVAPTISESDRWFEPQLRTAAIPQHMHVSRLVAVTRAEEKSVAVFTMEPGHRLTRTARPC